MKLKYGMQKAIMFDTEEAASNIFMLGDGNCRIQSFLTDNGIGVVGMVRDGLNDKPFAEYEQDERPPIYKSDKHEKTYLVFESVESVDALIARLQDAKSMMIEGVI